MEMNEVAQGLMGLVGALAVLGTILAARREAQEQERRRVPVRVETRRRR